MLPRAAEIVGMLGEDVARRLIQAFGGVRVYVPVDPGPDCELTRALGLEEARAVAMCFGGDRIHVPIRLPLRARIAELHRAGHRTAEIARTLGCTERRVYQVLASPIARLPRRDI